LVSIAISTSWNEQQQVMVAIDEVLEQNTHFRNVHPVKEIDLIE
jgi:hypothetical protein